MREGNRASMSGRLFVMVLCAGLLASAALAEITITDHNAMLRQQRHAARHSAIPPLATGSHALVDAGGVQYFINDDITFSTSSSASGAMSEASYTQSVAATTSGGGTSPYKLNDAYDGYQTVCVSFTGATGTCEVKNSDFVIYNKNGPATGECVGTASKVNRQYVFGTQVMGPGNALHVFRKVFVPDNEQFARWLNYFTNTGATPLTFNVIVANNLGSDASTLIVTSSTGSHTSPFTDTSATWVTTFQNWGFPAANQSSDPRLGHVLQSGGAPVPLSFIHFADGDDNPYWGYTLTLQPGETRIIMNFGVVQASKAAAKAKAEMLVTEPPISLQCMTPTEVAEVGNFAIQAIPAVSHRGLAILGVLLLAAAALVLRTKTA